MKRRFNFFTSLILLLLSSTLYSQTTIISESLTNGSTSGRQFGGSFTSEGYKPGVGSNGISSNHIMYRLSSSPDIGYIEFEVKGFDYTKFPTPTSDDPNFSNTFVILYDGRGVTEPIRYFSDYRNNYFRWEVVYRGPHSRAPNYGNRFKAKMLIASPSLSNGAATAKFTDSQLKNHDVIWKGEPDGVRTSWDKNRWYKIRISWDNKNRIYQIFRDGVEVWNMNKDKGGPNNSETVQHGWKLPPEFPRSPKDFRFNLGAGPANHDEYQNAMPNIVYRNLKVVSLKNSTPTNYLSVSPSSKSVGSTAGNTNLTVSSNVSWKASSNRSWLTVSPTSDNNNGTIKATYSANTSSSSRSATVTVTGDVFTRTSTITQAGQGDPPPPPPPSEGDLVVTSPSSGQTLVPGSTHQIMWSGSTKNGANVGIYFSSDGGNSWINVAGTTPNDGKHNWTVRNVISNNCIIRVKDLGNFSNFDRSDIFKIAKDGVPPPPPPPPSGGDLMVTSPSSGQTLVPGSTHKITWTGPSSITKVIIFFSSDNGNSWSNLGVSPNDGNQNWTVPNSISKNCLIRVKDVNNWKNYDRSDIFSISKDGVPPPPSGDKLMVTSPSAGQTLSPGSVHRITWTGPQSIANVVLFFSSDNGNTWTNIGGSPNDGTQSWTVPNVSSKQCIVRVKDRVNWSNYDRSDVFSISTTPGTLAKATENESDLSVIEIPKEYSVLQNYPNPFNPTTNIQFALPEGGYTELIVYNSIGQEVQKLVSEFKSEGIYNVTFNASQLASGIYFYTLRSGKFLQTNKMLLLE